ncbi:sema domain-containing protein [Ditylenchus destructor]|nr:sema domain-containing protein [Ditylenchus destructor]
MLYIVLLLLQWTVSDISSQLYIQPDNTFSRGIGLTYSQLLVDSKSTSLFVGARGHIFRLWLYNINDTASANLFASRSLETRPEERDECLRMGNSERECSHSVRQLFLKSNGQLLMCSSNAMPQLSTLEAQMLIDTEAAKTIIGICSPHEGLNTTAVYTEYGNPDDLPSIYSGIRTGLSLENHLIYRPPLVFNNKEVHPALRTIYTDNKWLNEPQFVGSFAINQYVYFFFRELAVEADGWNGGSGKGAVYSRVARVCKSDLGGKTVLRQVWSSFVKARLNCSVSSAGSSAPFYFDYLQSVYKLDQDGDTHFYATFTTSESPVFQASAVCAFSLNAINQVFDTTGVFLEQSVGTSTSSVASVWLPTPSDRIPSTYRPGTCVSDSRTLSDEELHFAKSHLLMADSVSGDSDGGPLFYRKDELLTKLVADQRDDQRVVLFILSPHRQQLLKVLHQRERGIIGRGRLLAVYQLGDSNMGTNPILSIAILPNEYLFLGREHHVGQYRLGQCQLHSTCHLCAADPYCSWHIARAECFAQETVHSTAVGWITLDRLSADIDNMAKEKCRSYVKSISRTIYPGDSVHLECSSEGVVFGSSTGESHEWRVERVPISHSDATNLVHTKNGGIILLNITSAQSGTYQCVIGTNPIIEYVVRVDDGDCARPRTVEQFRSVQREWCKKMGDYKSNFSKWQNFYDTNQSHCSRTDAVDDKDAQNTE